MQLPRMASRRRCVACALIVGIILCITSSPSAQIYEILDILPKMPEGIEECKKLWEMTIFLFQKAIDMSKIPKDIRNVPKDFDWTTVFKPGANISMFIQPGVPLDTLIRETIHRSSVYTNAPPEVFIQHMRNVEKHKSCNFTPLSIEPGSKVLTHYRQQANMVLTFLSMTLARNNNTIDPVQDIMIMNLLRNSIEEGMHFVAFGILFSKEVFIDGRNFTPCAVKNHKKTLVHADCPLLSEKMKCEMWFLYFRSGWASSRTPVLHDKIVSKNKNYTKFSSYPDIKNVQAMCYGPVYDCHFDSWLLYIAIPVVGLAPNTTTKPRLLGGGLMILNISSMNVNQCDTDIESQMTLYHTDAFLGTHKCHSSTLCYPKTGGFKTGMYVCKCREGYYFPDAEISEKLFQGSVVEASIKYNASDPHRKSALGCIKCHHTCRLCFDGESCRYEINYITRVTTLFFVVLALLFCVSLSVITFLARRELVMKTASPSFLQSMIWGGVLMCLSAVCLFPNPTSLYCIMNRWLFYIGYVGLYYSLVIKTWRISVIFSKHSKVRLTDAVLLRKLLYPLALTIVYLSVWTNISDFEPLHVKMERGRNINKKAYEVCGEYKWNHIGTLATTLLLLFGVYLCYTVRKAPALFNESKHITLATYNAIIFGTFFVFLKSALLTETNPDVIFIIEMMHVQGIVTNTLCLIFVPKLIILWSGQTTANVTEFQTAQSGPIVKHTGPEKKDKGIQTESAVPRARTEPQTLLSGDDFPPPAPDAQHLPTIGETTPPSPSPQQDQDDEKGNDTKPEVPPAFVMSSSADLDKSPRVDTSSEPEAEVESGPDAEAIATASATTEQGPDSSACVDSFRLGKGDRSLLQLESIELTATGSLIFDWLSRKDSVGSPSEDSEQAST